MREGKRGSEAARNWFCCEGPMCALAGVSEPQSGAITPDVSEYHWLLGKRAVRKSNPAAHTRLTEAELRTSSALSA
ncbi:hypothetical protein FQA47_020493 [Oryzias melastigma]|uniref:Uncharacterized protein n=1 Tax=Oryzias melastigma TaxID=30732 RepID=A0A834F9R4_ORYME|nr:hypothetical protein FQA47_020493 [Oryzias melastigma]